ncbi:hypothetical protein [Moheibacter lacus]|uniref:Uncharacterized protein n=1 Tax=Moheibacter lacus TaxID=2745851 RepID=A0A838ZT55_9FLAO|nr:hypothetical protein [Moheibacter lacus]MBA5630168.1 hypothetical protein [Moheibacter lacus]
MNSQFKKYSIYLLMSLFMLSMGTSFTVNLQYGENNMYNEIEHSDCNNNTLNEIKENFKKVCERIPQFEFESNPIAKKMFVNRNENLNCQFTLRFDTPPPEFVG